MGTDGHTDTLPFMEGEAGSEQRIGVTVLFSPDGKLVGRQFEVSRQLTMGRRGGANLELPVADRCMSRRHATISSREALPLCELLDHGSKNGTRVNGAPTSNCILQAGDLIRVGETLLEFGGITPDTTPDPTDRGIIGITHGIQRILREVDQVASSDLSVLLLGETGTGKELIAQRIHTRSGRSGQLVAVNCSAIPETLMETYLFGNTKGAYSGAVEMRSGYISRAAAGTLFLDEVGELLPHLQPKLLRVLETREYTPVGGADPRRSDFRLVSATNADLQTEVEAGRFRRDLFARLADFCVSIPPLRRRRLDIPILLRYFLNKLAPAASYAFSCGFVETLLLHHWPMNVRELSSVAKRIAILIPESGTLNHEDAVECLHQAQLEHAAPSVRLRSPPEKGSLQRTVTAGAHQAPEASTDHRSGIPPVDELISVLRRTDGNLAAVARHYGKQRPQVYRWLKRYGLNPDHYRGS